MNNPALRFARRFFRQNWTAGGSRPATAERGEPQSAPKVIPVDRKLQILNEGWGHARSRLEKRSVDGAGNPLPWYTYPAIEYLKQLDFSLARVFEWGSGGSSLFWSSRCREIISVERDREWYERVRETAPPNLILYHVDEDPDYANEIKKHGQFDVIVIDGNMRRDCAENAISHWRSGGLIVLDNSDWYTLAATFLRQSGLAQVDRSGFGPINDYMWSTSVYIHGQLDFKPIDDRLPMHGIGALDTFASEDDGRVA